MSNESDIPQKYIDVCRAIGRIAKEHKLGDLTASFNPGFDSPWRERIEMNWRSGRHYAETNIVTITSTRHVRATVTEPEEQS